MKISRKFVVYKVRPPTLKYFQSTHKQMDTTSPTALTPCTYFRRHRTLFSCPIKCLIKVDVPEVIQRIGTLCSADEDDPFGSWSVASNKHAPANIPQQTSPDAGFQTHGKEGEQFEIKVARLRLFRKVLPLLSFCYFKLNKILISNGISKSKLTKITKHIERPIHISIGFPR